ncbi:uncharacterized protein LOC126844301 isoform X2 [Adelges cooleyi]|uniref:uncharacterized protein LOC126844301 isoform X2 n=1 Tax=Adelges cooleyi TaxID=133065 RepID=UPI00217FE042|nr:uncharacterized protein LOC126844301 isoform X2 [Adelges cooleyi]
MTTFRASTTDFKKKVNFQESPSEMCNESLTPLMTACMYGRSEQIRLILEDKPLSVAERDGLFKTALHYCAENDDTDAECARLLLDRDSSIVDVPDEDGHTALHLAVIAGNLSLVRLLLGFADPNKRDIEGHSTVHWATVCADVEALELILSHGGTTDSADVHGGYALHYAAQMCGTTGVCRSGDSLNVGVRVLQLLLSYGADVNVTDKHGRQPIVWAASAGSADAIITLVNGGANVESHDKDGLRALHCAASRGHVECVDALLTLCGAEVDALDGNGCSALFYAVTLGHADATEMLLEHGADPNRQDGKGRTPAHCGAFKGQLETVRILAEHGANLWFRNFKGGYPLHDAVRSGRKELVVWLLSLRPEVADYYDDDGKRCLHIAALNNNTEMCKIILDNGASVNAVMKIKGERMTPLDVTIRKNNSHLAKFLKLYGGKPAAKLNKVLSKQQSTVRTRLKRSESRRNSHSSDSINRKYRNSGGRKKQMAKRKGDCPKSKKEPISRVVQVHIRADVTAKTVEGSMDKRKFYGDCEVPTKPQRKRSSRADEPKECFSENDLCDDEEDLYDEDNDDYDRLNEADSEQDVCNTQHVGSNSRHKKRYDGNLQNKRDSKLATKAKISDESKGRHSRAKNAKIVDKSKRTSDISDQSVEKTENQTITVPGARVSHNSNGENIKFIDDTDSSNLTTNSTGGLPSKRNIENQTTVTSSEKPVTVEKKNAPRTEVVVGTNITVEKEAAETKNTMGKGATAGTKVTERTDITSLPVETKSKTSVNAKREDTNPLDKFTSALANHNKNDDEMQSKRLVEKKSTKVIPNTASETAIAKNAIDAIDRKNIASSGKPQTNSESSEINRNAHEKGPVAVQYNKAIVEVLDRVDTPEMANRQGDNGRNSLQATAFSVLPPDDVEPTEKPCLCPDCRKKTRKAKSRIPRLNTYSSLAPDNDLNTMSVTRAVQLSSRKYHLERLIFYQLSELKRLQIRAGKSDERVLVKRLVEEYGRTGTFIGLQRYEGMYSFKRFEKYLYDQLSSLQKQLPFAEARTAIPRVQSIDEIEKITDALRRIDSGKTVLENPDDCLSCVRSTHRCTHATHAYTGIPCAAYIPKLRMDHHRMPKPVADRRRFLPDIKQDGCRATRCLRNVDPSKPITLKLANGSCSQAIDLPTEKLDKNKRYLVTFTIKGAEPPSKHRVAPPLLRGNSDQHPPLAHTHAKSF